MYSESRMTDFRAAETAGQQSVRMAGRAHVGGLRGAACPLAMRSDTFIKAPRKPTAVVSDMVTASTLRHSLVWRGHR